MCHQQFAPDQTTQCTFTSVVSQSIPKQTQRQSSSESKMCYSFVIWGRPSSIVVTRGCDKVLKLEGLGWVSSFGFSLIGESVASTMRVVESFQPPSSLHPSSYHPLLPSPPPLVPAPVYFQIHFFRSLTPLPHNFLQLTHIHSQGHTYHHDRVSGRDSTGMWHTKRKVFAQSSIRAEPLLSLQVHSFKNNVEDEMVMALTPSCQ